MDRGYVKESPEYHSPTPSEEHTISLVRNRSVLAPSSSVVSSEGYGSFPSGYRAIIPPRRAEASEPVEGETPIPERVRERVGARLFAGGWERSILANA